MLRREWVKLLWIEGLPADFQLALPHALSPLGMAVAEALHLELQDWFEGDRTRLAVVINQVDLGGSRQPRAGNIVHPMTRGRHALVLSVLNAGHGGFRRIEGRNDAFPDQGLAARAVEEDGVGNVVVPHQRRPDEEHARRCSRHATDLALADVAHAPGAVLGPVADRFVDLDLPVRVAHHATPAAELVEAGSVHYAPCARPQGLAGFLDRRRPGREGQVAG